MDAMTIDYPIDQVPEPGTLLDVADGVQWLRMPLPFALDHINLWVLDDGDGVTLVDTGVANDTTKELWDAIFAGPLAGRSVTRVIATHFHPDHMGLAGWLCDRFSVPLWATYGEWTFGSLMCLDRSPEFVENQRAFYRRVGLTDEQLALVDERQNPYARRVSQIPKAVRRIREGQTLVIGRYGWRVIVGRGHSPEHAALYCEDLDMLISGDQVLPRISPNVSVWPQEPDGNPLTQFMDSLEHFAREVPDSALVLPSHGRPFHGLHGRIAQLLSHHEDRLADTFEACATPQTAAELVPVLFRRKLDAHQLFFAVGEALSHLHALVERGDLVREVHTDGAWRFSRKAGTAD